MSRIVPPPLSFGLDDWTVDDMGFLHGPDCRTHLSGKGIFLLRALSEEPNRTCTGTFLANRLDTTVKAVHVYVSRLRRDFVFVGSAQDIMTLNSGYRLRSASGAFAFSLSVTDAQLRAIREAVRLAERQVPGISARTGLRT